MRDGGGIGRIYPTKQYALGGLSDWHVITEYDHHCFCGIIPIYMQSRDFCFFGMLS